MTIKELGHVVLFVRNLETSANFYRDTLGFTEIQRMPGAAVFSSGRTHHEMLLLEVGNQPLPDRHGQPGLYHIGFKIGDSDVELKQALYDLEQKGVPIVGTADHTVTHSLYILDPDENELELYVDINDAWKTNPKLILEPTKRLALE